MKKIVLLLLWAIATIVATGQKTRLNLYGAHVLDGSYISIDNYNYYNGKINGGLQFGGGVEFSVKPQCYLELTYLGQHTENATYNVVYNLMLNYALIGFNYYTKNPHENLQGFAGFAAGMLFAGIDDPVNEKHVLANKFSWAAKLGCCIWAGRVGVKLQSQLLSSILSVKEDVHVGSVGLAGFGSIIQFGIGGGLTFQLDK